MQWLIRSTMHIKKALDDDLRSLQKGDFSHISAFQHLQSNLKGQRRLAFVGCHNCGNWHWPLQGISIFEHKMLASTQVWECARAERFVNTKGMPQEQQAGESWLSQAAKDTQNAALIEARGFLREPRLDCAKNIQPLSKKIRTGQSTFNATQESMWFCPSKMVCIGKSGIMSRTCRMKVKFTLQSISIVAVPFQINLWLLL